MKKYTNWILIFKCVLSRRGSSHIVLSMLLSPLLLAACLKTKLQLVFTNWTSILILIFTLKSSLLFSSDTLVDDFLNEPDDLQSDALISRGPAATDQKTTNVNKGQKKIIYTYKQYEKFDFDDLNIEGTGDIQNDLSIPPIHEKQFASKLPYRQTFNPEIRKGVERVR